MSPRLATCARTPNCTPTKPSSVLFQGDVPPSAQRQIVEFSDFHLKDVDFAQTTGQRLALKEASVFKRPEDGKLQSRLVYEVTVAQGKPFYLRTRGSVADYCCVYRDSLRSPFRSCFALRLGCCVVPASFPGSSLISLADMTNRQQTLHGGCTAFLVDV